jgi:choice-of-anchor A domain-containing protein
MVLNPGSSSQDILSTFNLVTTGDVATHSDIEGSAVVGGNLTGSTFFNNNVPPSPAVDLYGNLGNTTGNPLNLDSAGDLYYSGTVSPGQVNFNGGGHHFTTLPNPLSTYTSPLGALSTQLSTLSATSGTSITNGNFNAGSNTGIVVFDIAGSQLETDLTNHDFSFTGTGVTSYIINVTGDFSQPSSTHFNTDQRNALFNFEDAATLDLGQFGASILAPDADLTITGGGDIEGSVFAASFSGGGELHNNNLFDGALPPTAVPEASTWAMMLAGFAGLGFVAYRRSRGRAVAV